MKGNSFGDYLPRVLDAELDELIGSLPAIALDGAKAVGKTVTASRRATAVLELDDPQQRAAAEADLGRALAGSGTLLIDEWQRSPEIWDQVRRAVDAGAPGGRFLLTGSASPVPGPFHSGAGRIVSLRMRPLSLAERALEDPTVRISTLLEGGRATVEGRSHLSLDDYTDEILGSGFPGVRSQQGRPLRVQLDGYLDRVIDKDFADVGREVRNPAALRRWLTAYAAATSTTASFETIRDAATGGEHQKPAKTTVIPYRDALERMFLLDPVPSWLPTRNHIAELGKPPKHHLADPALAARLVGATKTMLLSGGAPAPAIPRDGTYLGALFESLVTLSLRVYAQACDARIGHLRTHRGEHEVDLILERADGRILAIEVKLGAVPDDRSIDHLAWLGAKLGDDLLDSIVVTTGSQAYRRPDGIAVVPAALLGP